MASEVKVGEWYGQHVQANVDVDGERVGFISTRDFRTYRVSVGMGDVEITASFPADSYDYALRWAEHAWRDVQAIESCAVCPECDSRSFMSVERNSGVTIVCEACFDGDRQSPKADGPTLESAIKTWNAMAADAVEEAVAPC